MLHLLSYPHRVLTSEQHRCCAGVASLARAPVPNTCLLRCMRQHGFPDWLIARPALMSIEDGAELLPVGLHPPDPKLAGSVISAISDPVGIDSGASLIPTSSEYSTSTLRPPDLLRRLSLRCRLSSVEQYPQSSNNRQIRQMPSLSM